MLNVKRGPTIIDVAKAAGVSTATVSRVINRDSFVKDKTRMAVEDAINQLGYRRNSLARGLVTGKTGVIGILIPDVIGPLYGQIARGIEEVLLPLGIHSLVVSDNRNPKTEKRALELLLERQVDGIILVSSYLSNDALKDALPDNFPAVFLQPELTQTGGTSNKVELDNASGIKAALEYLFEMGHTEIAHIAGIRRDGLERRNAFETIMREANLNINIIESDGSELGGVKAATELLELPQVTAVQCNNDRTALGLYHGLKTNNVRIPDDMSVVGFGDLVYCAFLDPPLTSVQQSGLKMGKLIAEYLLMVTQGETSPNTLLPSKLSKRASVKCLKGVVTRS